MAPQTVTPLRRKFQLSKYKNDKKWNSRLHPLFRQNHNVVAQFRIFLVPCSQSKSIELLMLVNNYIESNAVARWSAIEYIQSAVIESVLRYTVFHYDYVFKINIRNQCDIYTCKVALTVGRIYGTYNECMVSLASAQR